MHRLLFSPQAKRDSKKIATSGLKPKVLELLALIEKEPLIYPPKYEFLTGSLQGKISR